MFQPCFAQTSTTGTRPTFQGNLVRLNNGVFPLVKVAECDRQGSAYESADFNIYIRGSVLSIQGRDLSGNAWTAETSFSGPGCKIFQADLDVNGRQDLIIFAPGIGSRGLYDTHLTMLLFDAAGKPVPWSATGYFSLTSNGIAEISPSPSGGAVVLHNYIVGHPSWGGVSYIARLYKVANAEISTVESVYSGTAFPVITGARASDPTFQKAVGEKSLSTVDDSQKAATGAQTPSLHFVRYGTEIPAAAKPPSGTILTPEQGAGITIDMSALNAGVEHLILSDGSKLDLPTVLILDSANGARRIVFSPESRDLTQLENGSYSIQQLGTDCLDVGDCRPFILRAVEQSQ